MKTLLMVSFSGQGVEGLRTELRRTRSKALAPGSNKNLQCQWKKFLEYMDFIDTSCLPIDVEHLCLYIQFLARSLKSPQSIRNYVSGLKSLHLLCGLEFPNYDNVLVRLTFKGVENMLQHCPQRASPVTPQLLCKIYNKLDLGDKTHVVLWCLFVFMFFLFARKSQFMCDRLSSSQLDRLVKRRDVTVVRGVLYVLYIFYMFYILYVICFI